ncbi:MAG: hypothetical protein ACMXX7_01505 [Candidatus Woesearchaeota archaeon]
MIDYGAIFEDEPQDEYSLEWESQDQLSNKTSRKPKVSRTWEKIFDEYKSEIATKKPQNILYAAANYDITPANAFNESQLTYQSSNHKVKRLENIGIKVTKDTNSNLYDLVIIKDSLKKRKNKFESYINNLDSGSEILLTRKYLDKAKKADSLEYKAQIIDSGNGNISSSTSNQLDLFAKAYVFSKK